MYAYTFYLRARPSQKCHAFIGLHSQNGTQRFEMAINTIIVYFSIHFQFVMLFKLQNYATCSCSLSFSLLHKAHIARVRCQYINCQSPYEQRKKIKLQIASQ